MRGGPRPTEQGLAVIAVACHCPYVEVRYCAPAAPAGPSPARHGEPLSAAWIAANPDARLLALRGLDFAPKGSTGQSQATPQGAEGERNRARPQGAKRSVPTWTCHLESHVPWNPWADL